MNSPLDPSDLTTSIVSSFYDRFPYPPDSFSDVPPPGYNWRWCVDAAYAFCTGAVVAKSYSKGPLQILDAGCGSGVSTDYIGHLNPGSEILAVDISAGTLEVARERVTRSGASKESSLRIEIRNLLDLEGEGPFDYINSVGVLHHLSNPEAGLKALGSLLKPGALMHLFLYADSGRQQIHRAQKVFKVLGLSCCEEELRLGRNFFDNLPKNNQIKRDYEERWVIDCSKDASFADMYLHPQETNYNLETLFSLIDSSGLKFVCFSNPNTWDLKRFLKGELLKRANALSELEKWKLIEEIDSEISHFEFFLSKGDFTSHDWSNDRDILASSGQRSRCFWGWPGRNFLDFNMDPQVLSSGEFQFLNALDKAPEATPFSSLNLKWDSDKIASVARDLQQKQVLLLSPGSNPAT